MTLNKLIAQGKDYLKKSKHNEAISLFSEILNQDKNNSEAYFCRAVAYNKIKEPQKAIKDIKKSANLGFKKAVNYLKSTPESSEQKQ